MQVLAVPVKALDRGKRRLSGILTPSERSRLVFAMFRGVLEAALAQHDWTVLVVSPSEDVLAEAERRGAVAVPDRGGSLRSALRQIESTLASNDDLAILLADLPRIAGPAVAASLAGARASAVSAVAAHSDGGTNLLVRCPAGIIPNRFGRSSFERHRAEAMRAGATFREIHRRELAFDLDTSEDVRAWLADDGAGPAYEEALEMGLPSRVGELARR